ncbi:hypothetical protein PIB30_013869 [Stylosanthes scabra]|uniref:Uncharacterized protein n=1 Tax=Stylosanthes scabra TaxID=79078 RepID=A0ABU6U5F8_9FABA|nr:hypothetical protein [Stylosanthes scabra]
MEQNVENKSRRLSVKLPEFDVAIESVNKHSHMLVTPKSQAAKRKMPNGKFNCLCSPTTHAGSFRCRHHREKGLSRGRSVSSNLSSLNKTGTLSDSIHAQ